MSNVSSTLACLSLSGILVGSMACGSWPKDGGTPVTTGSIGVTVGFGAGTNDSYTCTVTGPSIVVLQNAQGQEVSRQGWSISGSSTPNTSPACTASLTFVSLQPGTYALVEAATGTKCSAVSVSANRITSVVMRVDAKICLPA